MSLVAAEHRLYQELENNKKRIMEWELQMGEEFMYREINCNYHYIYSIQIIWDEILVLDDEIPKNYKNTVYIGKKTIGKD